MQLFLADMKKFWNYTLYSAKSQLKTEVASSYLNWLWWIIEPLCFMLIYSFIFGFMLSHRQPFFNCYIFLGITIWDFFSRCIKNSVRMVKRNKAIVSKVYIPKFMLLISDMMVNGFKMMICMALAFILIIFSRVPLDWHVIVIIPCLMVIGAFTFACSTLLLHMGVFVDDMANVINIVLRFVFYLTGIFYNISAVLPEKYAWLLLKLNPVAMVIDTLRQGVLYQEFINVRTMLLWFVISIIVSVFGIRNIYKNENTYVKVI